MDDVIAIVIWWTCGFAGFLWALDAMNRNLARKYPSVPRDYITRAEVLLAALMGTLSFMTLIASAICAIAYECGSRNMRVAHWLRQPAFKRRAMLRESALVTRGKD